MSRRAVIQPPPDVRPVQATNNRTTSLPADHRWYVEGMRFSGTVGVHESGVVMR